MELVNVQRAVDEGRDIEPPCVRHMSEDELRDFLQTPLKTGAPCHTQSTERAVKLTTESVTAVTGADRQDGYALNKRAYRNKVKK